MSEDEAIGLSLMRVVSLPSAMGIVIEMGMLPHWIGGDPFRYSTAESTAFDLVACIDKDNPVVLGPGERRLIPTGLCFRRFSVLNGGDFVTPDFQIRSRSGLAFRNGIQAHYGTIDADYPDEIQVLLFNFGEGFFTIRRGDRIAQVVIGLAIRFAPPNGAGSERTGGFGSTGVG